MNAAEGTPPLPPPATVSEALRVTTERLAAEAAAPQLSAPAWSEFEWHTARAVAAMHGISGILAQRLLWRGPGTWQEFLCTQREHIERRHLRIRQLLGQIDAQLRIDGIPALALKGAALHEAGIYRPGERPMGDVDLLVGAEHVTGAAEVLASLGLRESFRTIKNRVFDPEHCTPPARFGEHADNDMKVELHERIIELLPVRLIEISRHMFAADARPGLNGYRSRSALMAHLLLHAAGSYVDRSLRLIQLHDIALLGRCLTCTDWQELLSWRPWWAFPALTLTARYYVSVAPAEIMERFRKLCPVLLRRFSAEQKLSDVSLSCLWVDAFPGLAWARSPGDAASYILGRIVPSAQVRSDRQQALRTEQSLAECDWARLSQRRRILRFLTAPTARPWPMYNVRAALAQRR